MPWVLLLAAGGLEIVWAIGLKQSHGFTRLLPSLVTVIAMLGSFGLLGLAVRDLPMGIAYAVWTGIGTVGTVLLGIWLLGDQASVSRLACIMLIVGGIAGLKLTA